MQVLDHNLERLGSDALILRPVITFINQSVNRNSYISVDMNDAEQIELMKFATVCIAHTSFILHDFISKARPQGTEECLCDYKKPDGSLEKSWQKVDL